MRKIISILTILAFTASNCTGQTTKEQAKVLNDTIELEVEAVEISDYSTGVKTHYTDYAQRPHHFVSTDTEFVVVDADGYVNLRNEPSANSEILTTIPNYTVVNEIHGKVGNWLLVYFSDSSAKETGYGYIHKSRLVQLPQNNSNSNSERNKKLSRVLTLISTGQKKDFTLQVFLFTHTEHDEIRSGAVLEEGKNKTSPISFYYGIEFLHEIDYKNADYDFDENAPEITRYFFKENWNTGIFAFDEQEATNLVQTGSVISKALYFPDGKTKINFVIKEDVVLSKNVRFSR